MQIEHKLLRIPLGGWPVGYLRDAVEELNSGIRRTNLDSGRVEDLNQGPPDFKFSALNHSATYAASLNSPNRKQHPKHYKTEEGIKPASGVASTTELIT